MSRVKSTHQQRVERFMELAGQKIPAHPITPDGPTRELRSRLIIEEALETTDGLGVSVYMKYDGRLLRVDFEDLVFSADEKPDIRAIADGCWDSRVVVTGTLSACGIADEDGQRLVDEGNLNKFGPGHKIRQDGKVIKPPDFKHPDIYGILFEQGLEK